MNQLQLSQRAKTLQEKGNDNLLEEYRKMKASLADLNRKIL